MFKIIWIAGIIQGRVLLEEIGKLLLIPEILISDLFFFYDSAFKMRKNGSIEEKRGGKYESMKDNIDMHSALA